jgi:hypothetical protein
MIKETGPEYNRELDEISEHFEEMNEITEEEYGN